MALLFFSSFSSGAIRENRKLMKRREQQLVVQVKLETNQQAERQRKISEI